MKKIQLMGVILLLSSITFSQDYFQQHVDYKIDVHLDDKNHTLEGTEIITYKNNSSKTLSEIYFHLWANAYKNKNTAFGKQKLRNGEKDFYFAKADELGGYTELSFSSQNMENQWEYDTKHKDIAKVQLKTPLKSGESVEFIIHFTIKIPIPFSRFNRVKKSYNITQWYPKPAVFDKNGWHPMPYLDFGEFYSELGDFDVTITLPSKYVVGATGTLTTPTEMDYLDDLVAKTDSLIHFKTPVSRDLKSNATKTINYVAKQVHDFAWFANTEFLVGKKDFELASGTKKTAWTFYTEDGLDAWKDVVRLVKRAVTTQSQWIGDYPYPQATAIMGETPVGGGMEYPMITNIAPSARGRALDEVIRHEVGHNWFYGILATNERQFAWMDEGINSYYDGRYARMIYPEKEKSNKKKFLDIMGDSSEDIFLSEINCNTKNEANPTSDAEKMSTLQYVYAAYNKPAKVFRYLELYLGKEKFDSIMRQYFENWKFKHPYPRDIQHLFEQQTGKDLSWAFEELLGTTNRMDYSILAVKHDGGQLQIKVGNLGSINAPFSLDILKDDVIVKKLWIEGFADVDIIGISEIDYDHITIDSKRQSLDVDARNNTYFKKSHKFKPIVFKPIFSMGNSTQNRIHYFPIAGWNDYNKTMVGMSFYSIPFPAKKIDYWLSPMYSFTSKSLNGFARLRYNVFPDQFLSKISIGVNARKFSEYHNTTKDLFFNYKKINPYIKVVFKNSATSYIKHSLLTNFYYISNNILGDKINQQNYRVTTIAYQINNSHPIFPTFSNLEFENNNIIGSNNKLSLEVKQKWFYQPKSSLAIRLFVGVSPFKHPTVASGFSLYGTNFSDYKYSDITRFRNGNPQYVTEREGGFKNYNVSIFEKFDYSESIIATNLTFELPKRFRFIQPYFDFAILGGVIGTPEFHWATGVSLGYKDYFNVYFPIAGSNTVAGDYKKQISFSVNLIKLDPWNVNYKKLLMKMIN